MFTSRFTSRSARVTTLAVAALLTITACSDDAAPADEPGAQAEVSGESLDAAAFADLAAADGVVILDVRTPEEFAEGHLEGAVNLDVSSPDFAAGVAELDPAATYAVYCRSGNRSQTAMQQMQRAGIASLADLAGGIQAWVDAGNEVVTGS